jgi:putative inorganic carbon (hco3(-)) transporter
MSKNKINIYMKNISSILVYGVAVLLPFLFKEYLCAYLGIVVLFYGLTTIGGKRITPAIKKHGLLLGLFVLVLIYSTIFSVSFLDSMNALLDYFLAIFIVLILQWVLNSKRSLFLFIQLLVISATMITCYGIVQKFMNRKTPDVWLDKSLHPDISTRITSLFPNPNNLAEFLVIVIPIIIGVIAYKSKVVHKVIGTFSLLLALICLVYTFSRSGYIGFVVAVIMFALYSLVMLFYIGTISIPFFIVFMPKSLNSRLHSLYASCLEFLRNPQSISDSSAAYRVKIWNGAFNTFKEFYIYGAGLGNEVFIKVYTFNRNYQVKAIHSHNIFLELGIELGTIGIIIFLIFITSVLYQSLKLAYSTDSKLIRIFSGSCSAGIIGLMASGISENTLYYHKSFYGFFILIGILFALYNLEYKSKTTCA